MSILIIFIILYLLMIFFNILVKNKALIINKKHSTHLIAHATQGTWYSLHYESIFNLLNTQKTYIMLEKMVKSNDQFSWCSFSIKQIIPLITVSMKNMQKVTMKNIPIKYLLLVKSIAVAITKNMISKNSNNIT